MVVVSPRLIRWLSFVSPIIGITIWPLIIVAESPDPYTLNHERIHLLQQTETLVIGFYFLYCYWFLKQYIKTNNYSFSYASIPFEKEAYAYEMDLHYLSKRKLWGFLKYT